ncbi:probable cyclin-dependent serine/threonine-protein kinase DDB_G0292550 isoform X2 [Aphis gossypii]|nr:probable cyclin-dependent serine/threonine-protein kinase DDB_G0292550 isoform X2 [Aphis gossypii]XP_027853796.2 probable cyclin-dependent serine/threonine-protein kinase DDB_G0292550 isoform X2 [Aphis gossypii]
MALNVDSNVLSSFENISSKVPFCNIDFNLPKSPWDIDDDFEGFDTVLCELVRNQYLKRLHETLLNNLDVTSSYKKKPLNQIQHCINLCMAELEKQALRRCMIARIYRKGMTNLINEVKTCTKNSMIYDLLKQIIESNNQIPTCNEYFKAENITNKSMGIDVSVNTEEKFNKTTSTQTEKWTDPDNNLNNNFPVNKFSTDLVNKPNLSHSSFNVTSEISESNIINNLKSSCSSNSLSDAHMEVQYIYESSEFENLQREDEQENSTRNEILSTIALLRDLQDSPESEYKQEYSDFPEPDLKSKSDSDSSKSDSKSESDSNSSKSDSNSESDSDSSKSDSKSESDSNSSKSDSNSESDSDSSKSDSKSESDSNSSKSDSNSESDSDSSKSDSNSSKSEYEQEYSKLEEHLIENNKSSKNSTELTKPINIDPCIVRSDKISEILSNKLKSKRVAKSYQLRKSMNKLPQRLQIRLNQKFKDLFGTSHSYEFDPLSEEEERIIVHKRIAKMVVEFMTPYYTARRIDNKNLFKRLARLISKNLMDRTYDQDERTVAYEVGKYFTGNRCIKTAKDFCIEY